MLYFGVFVVNNVFEGRSQVLPKMLNCLRNSAARMFDETAKSIYSIYQLAC